MEKVDISEFEAALQIDRHNLDTEIERQPNLYYEVASEAARAISRRDQIDKNLKYVEAELDGKIRRKFDKNNKSFTEAMVKATILKHDDHKEATKKLIIARRNAEIVGALRDAFRQRSYMLRDLVELHISGYYTSASIGGSSSIIKDSKAERIKQYMADKRDRKKSAKNHGET